MKLISAISEITHDDLVELFSTALYDGKITEKVYNALMNYHIEITD